MKSNQLSTHNLLSQSGATSLNDTPSMDLGHGFSLTLGGSLFVSDCTATTNQLEETQMTNAYMKLKALTAATIKPVIEAPVSTRMTFTIEELLEEKDYTYLTVSTCGGCRHEFPEFVPCDPGAEYHAFLVPTCPICVEALGGPLFDYDLDEDQIHLIYLAHEGNMGEGFWADEDAYNEFLDGPDEQDDWDSDNEKWANYWGDYNQCGIHVSY